MKLDVHCHQSTVLHMLYNIQILLTEYYYINMARLTSKANVCTKLVNALAEHIGWNEVSFSNDKFCQQSCDSLHLILLYCSHFKMGTPMMSNLLTYRSHIQH